MYSGVPMSWPCSVKVGRLGDPEVDDLGDGPVILDGHQDVRGLEVAVDDALLMGMLDRLADGDEEPEAVLGGEPVPVAVVGEGNAPGELHNEIGTAGLGGSGVEDLGDIGVVHDGQGLTLCLEPGHHIPGVHAEFYDLHGDAAMHGLDLLSQVDHAHAAASQLLEELIPAREERARQRILVLWANCPGGGFR